MGYHVRAEDYNYCIEAGVNVIQFFPNSTNASSILKRLDELQSYNLMAFVALYNSYPAGHDNPLLERKVYHI